MSTKTRHFYMRAANGMAVAERGIQGFLEKGENRLVIRYTEDVHGCSLSISLEPRDGRNSGVMLMVSADDFIAWLRGIDDVL